MCANCPFDADYYEDEVMMFSPPASIIVNSQPIMEMSNSNLLSNPQNVDMLSFLTQIFSDSLVSPTLSGNLGVQYAEIKSLVALD